jgi:hypothetical protein
MMHHRHFSDISDFYATFDAARKNPELAKDANRYTDAIYFRETSSRKMINFVGADSKTCKESRYGMESLVSQAMTLPGFTARGDEALTVTARKLDDQDGDDIDMERYLEGDERCLIRRYRKAVNRIKRIRKIAVNIGENCNVTPDRMLWKAYAAIRLVDAIESAGDRCEIIVHLGSSNASRNGDHAHVSITVKRPEEPANLSLIAWTFSPYFFRYYMVPAICLTVPNVTTGYGHALNITEEYQDAYYLASGECLSRQQAENWLTSQEGRKTDTTR